MRRCLCPYCTAPAEEAESYFALFCDHEVKEERRLIGAAPTLHLTLLSLDVHIQQQVLEQSRHQSEEGSGSILILP